MATSSEQSQLVKKTCHSERSDAGAKSKNLRIIDPAKQFFNAKILRLAMLAQDDNLKLIILPIRGCQKILKKFSKTLLTMGGSLVYTTINN